MLTATIIAEHLQQAFIRRGQKDLRVTDAKPLTGGAAAATWRLALHGTDDISRQAILRLGQGTEQIATGLDKTTEAEVVRTVHAAGIPAPEVLLILTEEDGLGEGYIMSCLPGEALPMKLLRQERYTTACKKLTQQCAQALAHIHRIDTSTLRALPRLSAERQLEIFDAMYRGYDQPLPTFELTARWLRQHLPGIQRTTLVHGDFRMGNLLVEADTGLTGVLDWELSHLGDPMEDLGWLCVNSWRFGNRDKAVGGFGSREELYHWYGEYSDQAVDSETVFFWELFGVYKWGVICLYMSHLHLDGQHFSLEHAAIGRRVSETEIDMLDLLQQWGYGHGQ